MVRFRYTTVNNLHKCNIIIIIIIIIIITKYKTFIIGYSNYKYKPQLRCNIMYLRKMVCVRCIIVKVMMMMMMMMVMMMIIIIIIMTKYIFIGKETLKNYHLICVCFNFL
jgi:hypothetical protein